MIGSGQSQGWYLAKTITQLYAPFDCSSRCPPLFSAPVPAVSPQFYRVFDLILVYKEMTGLDVESALHFLLYSAFKIITVIAFEP